MNQLKNYYQTYPYGSFCPEENCCSSDMPVTLSNGSIKYPDLRCGETNKKPIDNLQNMCFSAKQINHLNDVLNDENTNFKPHPVKDYYKCKINSKGETLKLQNNEECPFSLQSNILGFEYSNSYQYLLKFDKKFNNKQKNLNELKKIGMDPQKNIDLDLSDKSLKKFLKNPEYSDNNKWDIDNIGSWYDYCTLGNEYILINKNNGAKRKVNTGVYKYNNLCSIAKLVDASNKSKYYNRYENLLNDQFKIKHLYNEKCKKKCLNNQSYLNINSDSQGNNIKHLRLSC